jgi:hypothetical protein
MNERQKELYRRLKSAKKWAVVNRIFFFFCLAIAALDHYTGERMGEIRFLWSMVGSSLFDGMIAAWARRIIEDIDDIKKGDNEKF